jgi:hypothetical protein
MLIFALWVGFCAWEVSVFGNLGGSYTWEIRAVQKLSDRTIFAQHENKNNNTKNNNKNNADSSCPNSFNSFSQNPLKIPRKPIKDY